MNILAIIVRYALLVLSLVPMLLNIPYLRGAYASSPLDADGVYYLYAAFALMALVVSVYRPKVPRTRGDIVWSALLLGGITAVYALGCYKHIYVLMNVAAVAYPLVWMTFYRTRAGFVLLVPAVLIGLCGVPNVRFWVINTLAQDDVAPALQRMITLIFSLAMALYTFAALWRRQLLIQWHTLLFFGAAAVLFCVPFALTLTQNTGMPFVLAPGNNPVEPYVLTDQIVTPDDIRIFGSNKIERKIYQSNAQRVAMLKLKTGSNIHAIHPPEVCMNSAGYSIDACRPGSIVFDENTLHYTELVLTRDGETSLMRVWYSCGAFSCGNFMYFRTAYSPDVPWFSYQILTPVQTDVVQARACLDAFMNALRTQLDYTVCSFAVTPEN